MSMHVEERVEYNSDHSDGNNPCRHMRTRSKVITYNLDSAIKHATMQKDRVPQ